MRSFIGFLTSPSRSFLDKRRLQNDQSVAAGAKFTETYHTYEEVRTRSHKTYRVDCICYLPLPHHSRWPPDGKPIWLTRIKVDFRFIFFSSLLFFLQIIGYLNQLANDNAMVTVATIGVSFEGRDIVTTRVSSGGETKEAIYLECGMHAREWIAHSTCIWIIDQVRWLSVTCSTTPSTKLAMIDYVYCITDTYPLSTYS